MVVGVVANVVYCSYFVQFLLEYGRKISMLFLSMFGICGCFSVW
jgi:hypothetical protein